MSDETYYAWIGRQSIEVQNFALGTKAAQMLRDGKINSKDITRLQMTNRLSIADFSEKASEIVTGQAAKKEPL